MLKKIPFIFLTFLFAANINLYAQALISNDAGIWNTFTIQHDLNKKNTISIDQELRFKENYSQVNLFYTQLSVAYKITKSWKIEPSFRHIDKVKNDGTLSFRNRFSVDLTYKKKIKKFSFSQRGRYQMEYRDIFTSKQKWLNEKYFRLRTLLEYTGNERFQPYYSCEFRYQIDVPGSDVQFNGNWHRIRNVLGVNIEINKKQTLNIYYLVQNEFNISPPENSYITGLQYSIKL